jgi:hypothetical protein
MQLVKATLSKQNYERHFPAISSTLGRMVGHPSGKEGRKERKVRGVNGARNI